MHVRLVAGLLCSAALAGSGSALAHDENVYFSVQGGRSFTKLTDIREVGGSFEPGTTAEQPSLKDANLYGAKFGVYSRTGVLGLEGEVFRTRPDPKNQTQTFFEPTFGPFSQTRGGDQRVTTWAVNVVGRFPLSENWVAHAGAGPAYIRSHIRFDNERSQTADRVGLNTQLGLTYFVTKQVQVSAEWKHNEAKLKFPTHGTTEGFKTDYRANHIAVSVSYAFDWASPWRMPSLRRTLGLEPAHLGPQ